MNSLTAEALVATLRILDEPQGERCCANAQSFAAKIKANSPILATKWQKKVGSNKRLDVFGMNLGWPTVRRTSNYLSWLFCFSVLKEPQIVQDKNSPAQLVKLLEQMKPPDCWWPLKKSSGPTGGTCQLLDKFTVNLMENAWSWITTPLKIMENEDFSSKNDMPKYVCFFHTWVSTKTKMGTLFLMQDVRPFWLAPW